MLISWTRSVRTWQICAVSLDLGRGSLSTVGRCVEDRWRSGDVNSPREWQRPHTRSTVAHNVIVDSPTVIEHGHDGTSALGEVAVRKQGTLDFG